MAWIMMMGFLVLSWMASLCKMLFDSSSNSKDSFFKDGKNDSEKHVLLVFAHPDDESMFFAPTINYLTSRAFNVHILCLSTGNADGLGDIRKEELYLALNVLKVPHQNVRVVDHPELQDGFGNIWNTDLLAQIIEDLIHASSIDVIITFDYHGISGHCNHRDVYIGVRKLLQNTK